MKWPCIASHRYGFHDISQKNIHRNNKSAKINSPKRNIPENPIHRKRKFLENYNYLSKYQFSEKNHSPKTEK